MTQSQKPSVHQCQCAQCQQHPYGAQAKDHLAINRLVASLDEKNRRRFIGLLASHQTHGGIEWLHQITGVSRPTIRRGRNEIQHVDRTPGIRRAGAGRKAVEIGRAHV